MTTSLRVALCLLAFVVAPNLSMRAQTTPVRIVKVNGGPSGTERDGTFVLTSERSMFSRADDREVFVLFQWDGTPGPHKLVARWRSPDGRLTSNSEVDYVAQASRFGVYWSLPMTLGMALGFWSLEATVDGLPAGNFSFEITDAKVPAALTKTFLTRTDLYEKLDRLFVTIERATLQHTPLKSWAGAAAMPGIILTTPAGLDNADSLSAVSNRGARLPLTDVAAFNRSQGWTMLTATNATEPAPRATLEGTGIGSRCVSMIGSDTAGRAILDCTIAGRARRGDVAVLIAEFRGGLAAPGAPVLNDFGELIGIVGDRPETGSGREINAVDDVGTTILPIEVFVPATPTTVGALRASGATLAGLVGENRVLTANFTSTDKSGKAVANLPRQTFSVRDKTFGIVLWWDTRDRITGQATAQVFNDQNNRITTSRLVKVDVRKGQTASTAWGMPMPTTPGKYRVDVLLGTDPVWRDALTVTP